jgi:hypothetical protein
MLTLIGFLYTRSAHARPSTLPPNVMSRNCTAFKLDFQVAQPERLGDFYIWPVCQSVSDISGACYWSEFE